MDDYYSENKPDISVSQKSDSGNKSLIVVIVIMLLVAAGLFFFLNSGDDNADDVTPTPTPEPTEEVEPTEAETTTAPTTAVSPTVSGDVVVIDVPGNWKEITEISSLEFRVYRPSNFYFRYWNGTTLGIDPAPLPDIGDYAGVVNITRHSTEMNQMINQLKSDLSSVSESSVTHPNGTWKIVSGIAAENPVDAESYVKYAVTANGGKTYVVRYAYATSETNKYEDVFKTFVGVINFNKESEE